MNTLNESGIYSITHCISGKRYIGQAANISFRFNAHKSRLRNNKHHSILLQRAWNKCNEDAFKFEVLEFVTDLSKLTEKEQYWIDYYQSADPKNGYNLYPASSSPLGYKHTEEHNKHLRESKLGKNNPNFGKRFSPEYRMLIRLGGLKNTKAGRLSGCSLRTWITTKGQRRSHWRVVIRIGSTRKYVGSFKTEQEAHKAYLKAIDNINIC